MPNVNFTACSKDMIEANASKIGSSPIHLRKTLNRDNDILCLWTIEGYSCLAGYSYLACFEAYA